MSAQIKTVGVVGTGTIGSSWIALFLAHGYRVVVSDPAPDAESLLRHHLAEMLPSLQKLGLSTQNCDNNLQFAGLSITPYGAELDFVQENGPENPKIKIGIIEEIANAVRSDVVIASSSSGLPSSQFIGNCKNPERVLIGHPFNPPHLMPLVEIVPHSGTSAAAKQVATNFYKACGRAPILVHKEVPGFAANRLQVALCREAYSLVNNGVLSAEHVDLCIINSLGPRWAISGPYISNVLAGGEGGFKHFMDHIGQASRVWLEDMDAHNFLFDTKGIETLDASVADLLNKTSQEEALVYRDAKLLELLKLKEE